MFFCVHKSADDVFRSTQLGSFMHTRIQNGILCIQEYKPILS